MYHATNNHSLDRHATRKALVIGLAAILALVAGPARADHIEVGVLGCVAGPSGGIIVMTEQQLACTFQPTSGPSQTYVGTVRKFGLDVGVTGGTVISWAVIAEEGDFDPGALAGEYLGVSADASLGAGAGVNVLLGGSNQAFVLQPVSIQGDIGVEIAVGITDLELIHIEA